MLLLAVLGVVVMLALLVSRVGSVVVDRAQARTAADAAALAGVRDGERGAREAAERNGGEVVNITIGADGVDVTVSHGGATAAARAAAAGTRAAP